MDGASGFIVNVNVLEANGRSPSYVLEVLVCPKRRLTFCNNHKYTNRWTVHFGRIWALESHWVAAGLAKARCQLCVAPEYIHIYTTRL